MQTTEEFLPVIGQKISGLRFPEYPGGADSPRAIVCTGIIETTELSNFEQVIKIRCENVHIQINEFVNHELRNGIVILHAPWYFLTEEEAKQAYVHMVEQDLREALSDQKLIDKRVNRIRTEYEEVTKKTF